MKTVVSYAGRLTRRPRRKWLPIVGIIAAMLLFLAPIEWIVCDHYDRYFSNDDGIPAYAGPIIVQVAIGLILAVIALIGWMLHVLSLKRSV